MFLICNFALGQAGSCPDPTPSPWALPSSQPAATFLCFLIILFIYFLPPSYNLNICLLLSAHPVSCSFHLGTISFLSLQAQPAGLEESVWLEKGTRMAGRERGQESTCV